MSRDIRDRLAEALMWGWRNSIGITEPFAWETADPASKEAWRREADLTLSRLSSVGLTISTLPEEEVSRG